MDLRESEERPSLLEQDRPAVVSLDGILDIYAGQNRVGYIEDNNLHLDNLTRPEQLEPALAQATRTAQNQGLGYLFLRTFVAPPGYEAWITRVWEETGTTPWFQHGFVPTLQCSDEDSLSEAYDDWTECMVNYNPGTETWFLHPQDYILWKYWVWWDPDEIYRIGTTSPQRLTLNQPTFASGRPYTRMDLFQAPDNPQMTLVSAEDLQDTAQPQPVLMGEQTVYLVPVSRYATSLEGGCYYGPEGGGYCGTFYYWEPDSEVYLNLGERGQYLIFHTKLSAALYIIQNFYLDPEQKDELGEEIRLLVDQLTNRLLVRMKKEGRNLEKTDIVTQILEFMIGLPSTIPLQLDYIDPETGKYWGDIFYALEDRLDQPLARAVREHPWLQVLLFTNMAGSSRAVGEILDARDRTESFRNLVWVVA